MLTLPRFGGIVVYSNMTDWEDFRRRQREGGERVHDLSTIPVRIQIVREDNPPTENTGYQETLNTDTLVKMKMSDNDQSITGKVSTVAGSLLPGLTQEITNAEFPDNKASDTIFQYLMKLSPSGALLKGWLSLLVRQPVMTSNRRHPQELLNSGYISNRVMTRQKIDENRVEYQFVNLDFSNRSVIKDRPAKSVKFGGAVIYQTEEDKNHSFHYSSYGPAFTFRIQVVAPGAEPTRETDITHPLEEDEIALGRNAHYEWINFSSKDSSVSPFLAEIKKFGDINVHCYEVPRDKYISSPVAGEITRAEGFKNEKTEPRGVMSKLDEISPGLMKGWLAQLTGNTTVKKTNEYPDFMPSYQKDYVQSTMDSDITRTVISPTVVEYKISPAPPPEGFRKTNFFIAEPV